MAEQRWWPMTLVDGGVVLRPLRRGDAGEWSRVRTANEEWLEPWEATNPHGARQATFGEMVRTNNKLARTAQAYALGIWVDRLFAGQITLSGLVWGSMRSGSLGYWIDQRVAGLGIMPTAVAMFTDHAFFTMGLHRIEINIRPENVASLRVVEKLGFRDEGVRQRYLHIDDGWRDHRTFALTVEEAPGGLLRGWRARRGW